MGSLFGQETGRVLLQLLNKYPLLGDLCLDIAVGTAAHPYSHRTGSRMTWKADHPHVVNEILAPELGAQSIFLADLLYPPFPVQIPEGLAPGVPFRGKMVKIPGRSLLDCCQRGFRGGAPDNQRQMVRRTGRSAQVPDLFTDKPLEALLVEQCLGLLIKESFVGRSSPLGDKKKFIGIPLFRIDVDLGRQVGAGIFLFRHGQRNNHRVTEVFFGIRIVNPFRQVFGIVYPCVDILALFTDNDGRSCVLAGRQLPFCRNHLVKEHGVGHKTVVVTSFRILQDGGKLGQMTWPEVKGNIGESFTGQQLQPFGGYLQQPAASGFPHRNIFTGYQTVRGLILQDGKRFLI